MSGISALDLSRKGLASADVWLDAPVLRGLHHLDLSRNAIAACTGIERVTQLRTLSLYYNRIERLADIACLRGCRFLSSLDLRLNPLCRLEAYRP